MESINLLLFDLLVTMLIVIDIYCYEKQVTPLTIFGGVYLILININNLIGCKLYDFYCVNSQSLCILFLFLLIIFFIDILWSYLYGKTKHYVFFVSTGWKNNISVVVLFSIGVMAYFLQFILLFGAYGLNIKGKNNGILGHLISLAFILGPVVMHNAIKKKKAYFILILILNLIIFCVSVAFGGKYIILINTTYFSLFFILQRNDRVMILKYLRIIFLLIFVAFGIFVILYYVLPRITGQYDVEIDFAIKHLFEYLLYPLIANNYSLSNAGQGNVLISFSVIINICKAIIGESNFINPIYPFIFPVNSNSMTNVSGLIGETVYNLGIAGAILYVALVFNIINYFYFQYRSKGKFSLSFFYSNAIMTFLFFCNFYTVSGVVLPLLLAFALDVLSSFKIGESYIL